MKRINILPKSVYNRIAAGEVVDRPYSAVKELVENSIDAGADEIEIYIENGGKQLIKVVDNGSGIHKDDLKSAFLPHATSKISTASDLDNILTLGFRGEALASISAVARVRIISVTEGNAAYKITCEGGIIGEREEAALEKGTEITVRNLFYNTPVRARFLKPDKKEETDITSFVARFILSKPHIKFKYFADGKLLLQSYGGGLEEAVAQIYGAKTLSQCLKIDAEADKLHIYGFIGNQNFFKPNKSYQSLFLNGRYIVNNTISTAISNAYSSYAMKRQFPFYVLNVDVPGDIVDVNVHPNKADVRFIDNRFIFGTVYKVISSVLDGTASAAEFVAESVRIPEIKSTYDKNNSQGSIQPVQQINISSELIEKYKPQQNIAFPEAVLQGDVNKEKICENKPFDIEQELPLHEFFQADRDAGNSGLMRLGEVEKVADNSLEAAAERVKEFEKRYFERKQQRMDYETCTYCGTLFNTYLIYENHDSAYIIDQHAAHERLLYDKLKKKIRERKVAAQPLLYPYVFEVNNEELRFIEKNLTAFSEIGFSVAPFGNNALRVDEVPADLSGMNLKEFFGEVLKDLNSFKEIKLEDILKDKLATTACKHAVKGGMKLSEQEVDALFKMLDGDSGLKCPHGRPVCLTLTRTEVEKMFKRIV